MQITSEMLKAARALLRWKQEDLAKAAGLSVETVKRLEKTPGPISGLVETANAIEAALTKKGIEFIDDRGEGVLKLNASARRKG